MGSALQYLEAHVHVLERVQSDMLTGKPVRMQESGDVAYVDYQAYFAEYFACQALADLARLVERPREEYGGAIAWGNG